MINKSKDHNPNYLCKFVYIGDRDWKDHPNADKLKMTSVDFQNVITGIDAHDGTYVYFPVECTINKEFLSYTNSFREKELNLNKEKAGFFDNKGRVRALRLRGEKSSGYIVPAEQVTEWAYGKKLSDDVSIQDMVVENMDREFDIINNKLLVEKYVVPKKQSNNARQGKKPKVSRLVDGQVHLHKDTENYRRNANKISPNDIISITYKTHGTSWWVANVLVKRKLGLLDRFSKFIGAKVQETEYDLVYGSRRVVKNQDMDDAKQKDHFFGYDLWEDIKNEVGDKIPKGYTLYGEMLGYDKNGAQIQKDYDYGCNVGGHKLEVYRITNTSNDGLVTELTYPEIKEFCERVGLVAPHLFYYGEAKDLNFPTAGLLDYSNVDEWQGYFVKCMEEDYNEKDCFMCKNTVPEEGIVVRKESLFEFEAYKLKSFRFLEYEGMQLDKGEQNIEDEN